MVLKPKWNQLRIYTDIEKIFVKNKIETDSKIKTIEETA